MHQLSKDERLDDELRENLKQDYDYYMDLLAQYEEYKQHNKKQIVLPFTENDVKAYLLKRGLI